MGEGPTARLASTQDSDAPSLPGCAPCCPPQAQGSAEACLSGTRSVGCGLLARQSLGQDGLSSARPSLALGLGVGSSHGRGPRSLGECSLSPSLSWSSLASPSSSCRRSSPPHLCLPFSPPSFLLTRCSFPGLRE